MQNPAEDEGTLQRRHSSQKQVKPHGSRSNKRKQSAARELDSDQPRAVESDTQQVPRVATPRVAE
ncbi:hypothetical protein F2Q68_00034479 [Brassica cretica]|uniref:Uncharacterized protein n=2 Tax=Brassica cretica TaxID=69181 RepID=A0A3N6U6J7_BRACR|nr:hypothetical protein F2Q68_00034479 [Brassica cretica]KAF3484665.1 hypothetical protein F2Q69_00053265 [Brassica cretica]KAF3593567.1 hypothetical protein DY000_02022296 [Brassica cretica]